MSDTSLHTNDLYEQLKDNISNFSTINMLSSFMMHSGID